jgi:hypothetical protein
MARNSVKADNGKYYFVPSFNMTNGTYGEFAIYWDLRMGVLYSGSEDTNFTVEHNQGTTAAYLGRSLHFSTAATDARPNILDTLSSCHERNFGNSLAVNLTELGYYNSHSCLVIEPNITQTRCSDYGTIANELEYRISQTILSKMECLEGAWQDLQRNCTSESEEDDSAASETGIRLLTSAMALALSLALSVLSL